MSFKGKSGWIWFVVVCLILILPAGVSAISVTGVKYMATVGPAETDTHVMTISAGSDPTDIQAEVYGFGQSPDQSYTLLNPAEDVSPYSARTYITLESRSLHVDPGTQKNLNAKISIPAQAVPGGRYALIYIHALPGKDKSFTTAVIVPVIITIPGTTPLLTGSITDLSVSEVIPNQPVTITTALKNTGNYHYYRTVNTVTVTDASGNPIGSFSTQPSVYAIIPGNTVRYIATPSLPNLPTGTYAVDSKILLEDGKVLDEKTTKFSVNANYIAPMKDTSITLTPGNAGTLTSSDGRISFSFPQGAVLGDAVVTLKASDKNALRPAPANAKLAATCFEITGLSGLLNKDATVLVNYSSEDLAAAGGDASQLKLSYFDTAQNVWVILPTKVDTGLMTLRTNTNHLSDWAVMVSSSTSTPASGPTRKKTPLPAVLSIAGIAATAILVRGRVWQRK